MKTKVQIAVGGAILLAALAIGGTMQGAFGGDGGADNNSILKHLKTISTVSSTVPTNGDVNPYGIARVQKTVGNLTRGHILISNFNNGSNAQGTGTTIVDVAPDGTLGLFAQIDVGSLPGKCPGGLGLTTALVVLRSGWVIVGSLPTSDGTSATAQAGCLIVLNSSGNPVETISGGPINGPWDMAAAEDDQEAKLFVTNVLNGTVAAGGSVVHQGTIVRVTLKFSTWDIPRVKEETVIASGFAQRTDPAALVIGATGIALSGPCFENDGDDCVDFPQFDLGDVLYVADSLNNRVAVIGRPLDRMTSAGTGETLTKGGSLNIPLGLIVAPNGNVLTVNGQDGFITEITPGGRQIAKELLDGTGGPPPGNGTLFGLIFVPGSGVYFVDDGSNTLNLLW
ncbi:MAG: hypothetical protein WBD66_16590 [Candidatus Acidiferrales bacterium]